MVTWRMRRQRQEDTDGMDEVQSPKRMRRQNSALLKLKPAIEQIVDHFVDHDRHA